MATLYEYFKKDQGGTFTIGKDLPIRGPGGEELVFVKARLHIDFEANALFISFYVPSTDKVECPSRILLNAIDDILAWRDEVYMAGGFQGQDSARSSECVFTGRIYLYLEDPVAEEDKDYIHRRSNELGQSVKFRDQSYAEERNRYETPLAFISHDSRDKESIASPLAVELQRLMCPVWYDEYSLTVGDSLREQIERGLRECRKCILILTPNYLANEGWGKKEFDSVFTRELIERQKVILPVWREVSKAEIYQYSPALADRVAANWADGVAEVARKLKRAVEGN